MTMDVRGSELKEGDVVVGGKYGDAPILSVLPGTRDTWAIHGDRMVTRYGNEEVVKVERK